MQYILVASAKIYFVKVAKQKRAQLEQLLLLRERKKETMARSNESLHNKHKNKLKNVLG